MTRARNKLHVEYADWEVAPDGSGYIARFSVKNIPDYSQMTDTQAQNAAKEHALGAARHLFRSRILLRPILPDDLKKDGEHRWVLHLTPHNSHLHAFERQNYFPRILPDVASEIDQINVLKELETFQEAEERKKSRFWPERKVEWHIANRMDQRMGEVGSRDFLALETPDMELAFQAALYLKKKGYITNEHAESTIDKIMQIKHLEREKEPEVFTISISGEHINAVLRNVVERHKKNYHPTDWKQTVKNQLPLQKAPER